MATHARRDAIVRGRLEAVADSLIEISLPGTGYRLKLVPTTTITARPGQRIAGTIEATALGVHAARGGGRFIEPIWGEPRILAGAVLDADPVGRRALVDVAAPVWVRTPVEHDFDVIRAGGLVNFYVESGTTFTPVDGPVGPVA